MVLEGDTIQTLLFAVLCICLVFYLVLGIYNYKRDKRSEINKNFFALCISASLWAIGYALMLISPDIETANSFRIVAALGWCSFNGIWVAFGFSLLNTKQKKHSLNIQPLLYILSMIFFIIYLMYEPSEGVSIKDYGFINNLNISTTMGTAFGIYNVILFTTSLAIIYFQMKNASKNRVKKQIKIILITGSISVCLAFTSDLILPAMGIMVFPFGIIILSIGMGGIWYAINKHKMMSISYELVSEYLFEAVNEPIFILGEDFLVKNCNEAALKITGFKVKELKENSLDTIINFRNFNFNTLMQVGNTINIEVDLHSKNKEALVCELSATVIKDEYKDILGILVRLQDVSEKNKIAVIQKNHTLKLEEKNIMLKNEIEERLLAEVRIRHFIYYDTLTELSNRKKMLEDIEILVNNKNQRFAILFIDLDKFKSINDEYGHEAGDTVLKTVALRLKNIISPMDTISRIGGDEFIIILRNLKEIINAEEIAAAVVGALSTAFAYKENQLFIGSSIGMSIFPEHGIDPDMLINKADFSMYEAKRMGGNGYKVYSTEIEENKKNLPNYQDIAFKDLSCV